MPEQVSEPDGVALVPARAGSKGLEQKNLQQLGGMSLVARAIAVAHRTAGIGSVIVSTDGEDIAAEAERHGASVHWRPPELATDDAVVVDTIRHVLDGLRAANACPPYCVLLEPTSPLRVPADVEACLEALRDGADSAATLTEAALHPNRAFRIDGDRLLPFIPGAVAWAPRQTLQPPAYQLTGAAYAFACDAFPTEGIGVLFGRIAPVLIPRERSLDIDDLFDLRVADALFSDSRQPPLPG